MSEFAGPLMTRVPRMDEKFRHYMAVAIRAAQGGHFGFAEKSCLCALDIIADAPEAINLLGILAVKAGANKTGTSLFREAVKLRPNDDGFRNNLKRSEALSNSEFRRGRYDISRYLLIKAWGYGFWSDVSHVVHWGRNSLYGGTCQLDAFGLFFSSIGSASLNEISDLAAASVFPAKWIGRNLTEDDLQKWSGEGSRITALQLLERPETVIVSDFYIGVIDVAPWLPPQHAMHGKPINEIYRYVINHYLKPLPHHLSLCSEFVAANLTSGSYIAVHLRGSDKAIEDPDLDLANAECLTVLAAQPQEKPIFLLTDDERLEGECRRIHGKRIICTNSQRTSGNIGLHYLRNSDPIKIGGDIMLDTYVATGAEIFIGNGRSNVAAIIALLKQWDENRLYLVCPSQLLERNLFIHQPS